MDYPLPDAVRVESRRPACASCGSPARTQLNAVNDELHQGLTRVFPLLSADPDARVAVITGEGRAFSAGGDFDLLDRMVKDRALRRDVIAEGRELVLNMIRCRVPWWPRSTDRPWASAAASSRSRTSSTWRSRPTCRTRT